jgi:hypothetical protein
MVGINVRKMTLVCYTVCVEGVSDCRARSKLVARGVVMTQHLRVAITRLLWPRDGYPRAGQCVPTWAKGDRSSRRMSTPNGWKYFYCPGFTKVRTSNLYVRRCQQVRGESNGHLIR